MVRNFRKYYGRKRYSRTLSKRNIYMHRSSRAQAIQLAAINRKVNRVYRACKPEKKVVHDGDVLDYDFDNSAFAKTWVAWTPPVVNQGPGDNERIGDKIFRQDKWKFTITYSNNASSTAGYHNGESSCALVRVICGAWKEPKDKYSLPTPQSIIHDYGSSASAYNVNCIQPLANGVTAEHKIFSDKVYKLTLDNPVQVVTAKTPFYVSRYDQQSYHIHSWLLVVTGDLDWDSSFTETVEAHGIRKTVFQDA